MKAEDSSHIRLIATDLDGTLLTSEGVLAAEGARLLKAVAREGIHVILATTRDLDSVRHFCQVLGISGPVICTNGLTSAVRLKGRPGLSSHFRKKLDWSWLCWLIQMAGNSVLLLAL